MAIKLGLEAKLYYSTGGGYSEITNARNVTLNLETGEADVTTRGNQGWRAIVSTLRDASVEFELVWNTADAAFTALKNAFLAATHEDRVISLRVLDGEYGAGGEGLQADFVITNFTRNENLEEALTVNVTAKVTLTDTPPQWLA